MKNTLKALFHWQTWLERFDTYQQAKMLQWKKRLNPLTNKIGYGIYFYKNMTINLNRVNKELKEISQDIVTLSYFNIHSFPSFISVADGIYATMFSKLPNHIIQRIISHVIALPAFKAVEAASRSYGYQCELHYNQGKVFFGSLQIYFKKVTSS
ncbi:hypothetical protein [Paenibacillus sp. N3.4]|uniref:hypothetical protein n=1 Tax=Paenibacillus sp. N3.4 TaxID=2603222 RepID=UPI0011C85489|nr:hypothetical protein [Paenibacillus sp. N3.4]TXK71264.1 hypothetical protein FU659_33190 [Paenibacillus sp. N3.4]